MISAILLLAAFASGPESALQDGLAFARAGNLAAAEKAFRTSSAVYPGDKRFLIELAGVLYRERRNEEAKRFLKRALSLDPSDPYANEFLGTIYFLDNNLPAALRYWNRIGRPLLASVRSPRPVPFSAGQVLTLERLRETERDLDGARVRLTPREDQRYDATIDAPAPGSSLHGWLGSLLPYARGLPYETVYVDRRGATALLRWDRNKRRIAGELTHGRATFTLDARDEHWNLSGSRFRLRKLEAGASLSIPLTSKLQWTPGIDGAVRRFDRIFTGGWTVEPRNRIDYSLIDWPERRLRSHVSSMLNIGHRYAIARGDFNASWFPQARGEAWEIETRLSGARTAGIPPFDEWFQLGMERDNDLWFRGIVGTDAGLKGSAPVGRNYALAETDLRRELFKMPFANLQAGPFFDVGSINGPRLAATGIEARIRTIAGTNVRVVYGRDLETGRNVFYTAVTR